MNAPPPELSIAMLVHDREDAWRLLSHTKVDGIGKMLHECSAGITDNKGITIGGGRYTD